MVKWNRGKVKVFLIIRQPVLDTVSAPCLFVEICSQAPPSRWHHSGRERPRSQEDCRALNLIWHSDQTVKKNGPPPLTLYPVLIICPCERSLRIFLVGKVVEICSLWIRLTNEDFNIHSKNASERPKLIKCFSGIVRSLLLVWFVDVEGAGIIRGSSRRWESFHSAVGHCITFIIIIFNLPLRGKRETAAHIW